MTCALKLPRVVKDRECTHVIMGTRGQGSMKGLLMGSVGAKVLHLVDVPTTFVH